MKTAVYGIGNILLGDDGVDEDHPAVTSEVVRQIQRGRAEVFNGDILVESQA